MFTAIKNSISSHFKKPTALEVAKSSIEEYQLKFLEHEGASAYHAKQAEYFRESITRMASFKPITK